MLNQHASLLPTDPLLLPQHSQIPVSISTSQSANITIPAGTMHIENNQQQNHNQISSNHQSDSQTVQNQNQSQMNHSHINSQQNHSGQQSMVQVQVQDNMVSVIEDSKDHKDLIASQLAQAQVQLNESHQLHQQTLTVQQLQHLQVQQVLDNVVRIESAVENQPNQSTGGNDPLADNMQIVKDEKVLQNCSRLLGAQFGLQVC